MKNKRCDFITPIFKERVLEYLSKMDFKDFLSYNEERQAIIFKIEINEEVDFISIDNLIKKK